MSRRVRATLALLVVAAVLSGCGGGEGAILVPGGNAEGNGTEVVRAPEEG